jgi:hypothetical protein
MPSILDKLRDRLDPEEEKDEEIEESEPNPLEEEVLAGSGLEVNELVKKISSSGGVNRVDATRGVLRALDEEHVRLVDSNPPDSLLGFFAPVYSGWFWVIIGFVALLFYSIYLMPQIYPLIYLRYTAGAVYVLYVPGYTLIEALYPKRRELGRLERFALSIGLSLALVPLVGLVLNYTPWGIRLDPMFVALGILTLALALGGVYRKYNFWRLAQR